MPIIINIKRGITYRGNFKTSYSREREWRDHRRRTQDIRGNPDGVTRLLFFFWGGGVGEGSPPSWALQTILLARNPALIYKNTRTIILSRSIVWMALFVGQVGVRMQTLYFFESSAAFGSAGEGNGSQPRQVGLTACLVLKPPASSSSVRSCLRSQASCRHSMSHESMPAN